jgi:hypothetical protein
MIRKHWTIRGAVFGAAIVGALGFGTTQAFAAPDPPPGFPNCQSSDDCFADNQCGPSGGICFGGGRCFCPR